MDESRFQPFSRRQFSTSLSWTPGFQHAIQSAKWSTNGRIGVSWRGVKVVKDPFTLSLYSSLLWELKPRTIVEFGSFEGGSACWLADISTVLGLDVQVVSFDIDPSKVRISHPRIRFLPLDLSQMDRQLDTEFIRACPRPLLILEDAHTNVCRLLSYIVKLLKVGDYLVVEDTCDAAKHRELSRFMQEEGRMRLEVDSYYTDNFGYNGSWNWNSFLRCSE